MELSTIIYLILALLMVLSVTNVIPVKIWLTAKLSNADLSFQDLVFMKFRGSNVDRIGMALITANKGQLSLTHVDLEVYEIAGGDSTKLVRACL